MTVTGKFTAIALLVFQIVMIVFYSVFINYGSESTATQTNDSVLSSYTQNVTVMVLVGFALIPTYLKSYSWSASAFSLLLTALVIQYYILWNYFWTAVATKTFNRYVEIAQQTILRSLYCCTAVLISYGTIVGRVGPLELFIMAIIQVIGYSANQMLCHQSSFLACYDIGGGMQIHTFGGVFGLTITLFLPKADLLQHPKNVTGIRSAVISFIGALFLWIFWPNFNSALAVNTATVNTRQIAQNNTLFALTVSTVTSFLFAFIYQPKIALRDVALASLSGAIAIASGADLIINVGGVMICSMFTAWISISGFVYFSKYLEMKGIYDTIGTFNLYLIPGILSGIFSAVFVSAYGVATKYLPIVTTMGTRTAYEQGGFQLACLFTTIGMALAFGAITGLILSKLAVYEKENMFNDHVWWQVPLKETPSLEAMHSSRRGQNKYTLELTSRLEDHFIKSPLNI